MATVAFTGFRFFGYAVRIVAHDQTGFWFPLCDLVEVLKPQDQGTFAQHVVDDLRISAPALGTVVGPVRIWDTPVPATLRMVSLLDAYRLMACCLDSEGGEFMQWLEEKAFPRIGDVLGRNWFSSSCCSRDDLASMQEKINRLEQRLQVVESDHERVARFLDRSTDDHR